MGVGADAEIADVGDFFRERFFVGDGGLSRGELSGPGVTAVCRNFERVEKVADGVAVVALGRVGRDVAFVARGEVGTGEETGSEEVFADDGGKPCLRGVAAGEGYEEVGFVGGAMMGVVGELRGEGVELREGGDVEHGYD